MKYCFKIELEMYARELIIVLVTLGVASATIKAIGKCKPGLTGLSSFDFNAVSNLNTNAVILNTTYLDALTVRYLTKLCC